MELVQGEGKFQLLPLSGENLLKNCWSRTFFYGKMYLAIRTEPFKGIFVLTKKTKFLSIKMVMDDQGDVVQLFDMTGDPQETKNLAGQKDVLDVEQSLKEQIFHWRLRTETVQTKGKNS